MLTSQEQMLSMLLIGTSSVLMEETLKSDQTTCTVEFGIKGSLHRAFNGHSKQKAVQYSHRSRLRYSNPVIPYENIGRNITVANTKVSELEVVRTDH